MRRRRPIDVRLDIQEWMARREGRARNGHGRVHQTGQLWDGRQAPTFSMRSMTTIQVVRRGSAQHGSEVHT
jgi:hypothetical protein